jgi:hypothetical protein
MKSENVFISIFNQIINEAIISPKDPTGKSFEKGQKTENNFEKLATQNGFSFKRSSEYEDKVDHFDGFLITPTKRLRIEIKGNEESECGDYILLELRSSIGKFGWVYGKAEFVALERFTPQYCFIMFSRPDLVKYIESKTKVKWENNQFIFDPSMLINDSCEAVAPRLHMRKGTEAIRTRIFINELTNNVTHTILYPKS